MEVMKKASKEISQEQAFSEPFNVAPNPNVYYQFKVSLKDINPPVWRRIRISGDATMWELATAIIEAMGWVGYHLHGFRFYDGKFGKMVSIGLPNEWEESLRQKERKMIDEYVAQWFSLEKRTRAIHDYDYGDGWEHAVVLEDIQPKEEGILYPQCMKGKRACPPEDCGGIGGYEWLIDVIQRGPKNAEERDMIEWYKEMTGREPDEQLIWEEVDVFHPEEVTFSDREDAEEGWDEMVAHIQT